MKDNLTGKIDKIILIILVLFMILPSNTSILNISIFKIETIVLCIITAYIFFTKNIKFKEIIKNKFIICNLIFAVSIALSITVNYKNILFNDLYEVIKYIVYPMITLIIIATCDNKEKYNLILKTISISMIITCIWGIIQYFNPFSINELYIKEFAPTQYETLINDYPAPRIIGIKTNPSVYGLLVTMGIYFNILYYPRAKSKFIAIISIVLCFTNLMMTLTRTIQIAFIISIVVYVTITTLQKKGWKKSVIYTLTIIVALILLFLILPKELTWRLRQIIDFQNASSWVGRVEKWKNYYELIKHNLLFGIGPIKNHVSELGYIDSEWIQNILQYGAVGFGVYVAMLMSPIFIWWTNKNNKELIRHYIPILVMIIINNISISSLILFDTACAIYIFMGMILINKEELNGE